MLVYQRFTNTLDPSQILLTRKASLQTHGITEIAYLPYLDETSMGKAFWISNAKAEDQLMLRLGHYTIHA